MSQPLTLFWWMAVDIPVSFWGYMVTCLRVELGNGSLIDVLLAVDWKSGKVSFLNDPVGCLFWQAEGHLHVISLGKCTRELSSGLSQVVDT